jgi:hypothetical protein
MGLGACGESDKNEIHAVSFFNRAQIEQLIDRNELTDGLSLAALLLYFRKFG